MSNSNFLSTETNTANSSTEQRKAYKTPVLSLLGDLRTLTLGASGLSKESVGFFTMGSPQRLPPGMPGDSTGPGGFIPDF